MKSSIPKAALKLGPSGLPNLGGNEGHDYEATSTRQTDTHVTPSGRLGRQPVRPVLTIVEGSDAGRTFAVEGDTVSLGRSNDCTVTLPDVGVSRTHARLVVREHDFLLEDLQSKNGTFVDGEPVTSRSLTVGDVFSIGPNVKMRLSLMDQSEERLARQLYDSSMRDALTGTYNRRYFLQRLIAELAFATRHDVPLSVVMLDLDHFKKVNDTHGHDAGDRLLQQVSRVIAEGLRSEDVLARIGGEEFVVLLRGTAPSAALIVAERIRKGVASLTLTGAGPLTATVSAGVATTVELPAAPTTETLLALADERLYAAKNAGRDTVRGGA